MEIQQYFEKMFYIQKTLLGYLDRGNSEEENYQSLINFLISQQIPNDHFELKSFFHLIIKIANHHQRSQLFYSKIEKIILLFKEKINQFYSNYEKFNIFKSNKRILLFLFQENIISPDIDIFLTISNQKYQNEKYLEYFFPEFQQFMNPNSIQFNVTNLEIFNQKRKDAENDTDVCNLIRNDMVQEFIKYINQTNFPLNSTIYPSVYETNKLLIKNNPSLMEYAAFYGSIQIFQYLNSNQIPLTPSLWIYAVHGRNFQILSFLNENHVFPPTPSFEEFLIESIKCHHFDATNFILSTFFANQGEKSLNTILQSIKYYNYSCFQINVINQFDVFCEFVKNDYFYIVKYLLSNSDINLISTCI